ncbi:uncharacterized protein A4U43_C03F14720 [Asparagus officinalis]|uniref:DUF629 domain-containing protein n=1 Tax=Asparagus officinalis TaxID=4686 RepID=A0A5P1FF22_ASPOF|nr:uncharacterized protein A4U43_C03F14720 [Asparagus officinalis]
MDQSQPCAPSSSSSSPTDGGLMSICKLVLPLLHSQEFDKADSLMEDARLRYRDFPSILALLRITGVIQLFKSEFLEEDLCVPDALCCAKIATQLSPFNLECSFFFVKLLVSYYRRYKVAIKECERSLAVINPISDAAGYLRASNFQEVRHVTPEEGWINYYREQLRSFLITARDALIDESLPAQHQDQELYDSSCPVSREVMDTFERALVLLHSNNFTKAGCLLQQANYRRHNSFAFFHRICALTHYYVYAHTRNKDLEAKKHWLQKAIASAERATILSPSNLEYSLFYVNLLICWGGIFPEVVKECERALAVTDPMDFFFERFLKDKTAKDRMAFYQHSLRSILKTHAVASTSTDPPPSALSDQAPQIPSQGDKPCPEHSSSLLAPTSTDPSPPSNEEKNLTDEPLPVCQQCEEPYSSPSIDSGKVKNFQEPCPSHSPSLPPVSTNAHPPPPSDVLKNLCKRALQVLHQDGPAKAQHVLNGVPHQHKSSAIFHRVRGLVLAMYAGKLTRDPECMLYNLRESLYSAHQATIISPNNLEFSVNYVRHLVSRRKYEEAEKECKRALAVTNPTDFLIECVSEISQETTATSRIALHQDHLQFHLHVIKRPNLSKKCKSILVTDGDAFLIRFHLQSLQTPTEWRDLLRVNVKDFKDRFKSTAIGDALCFGHENRSWKYWICPCCSDQEFNDSESMWQHMLKEHLREPSEELKCKSNLGAY